MASQASSGSIWLGVPDHKCSTFPLRFLQRWFGSTCRHIFIPLVHNLRTFDTAKIARLYSRMNVLQNALHVTLALLLMMWMILVSSSNTHYYKHQTPGFPNKDLWRRMTKVAGAELCLIELVGSPSAGCALDVEVGFVLDGALSFRLSTYCQSFPASVKGRVSWAEIARRRNEMQNNLTLVQDETDSVESMAGLTHNDRTSRADLVGDTPTHLKSLSGKEHLVEHFAGGKSVLAYGSATHVNKSSEQRTKTTPNPHNANTSPFKFMKQPFRERVSADVILTSRSWEPIAEDDGNVYVYSAFYDDRPSKSTGEKRRVRVLAMTLTHELREFPYLRKQVFCHFRWKDKTDLHVNQRGKIMSIPEDHNATYHAVFIVCDLNLCASPDYVGITVDRDVKPRTYLPIKYPVSRLGRFKREITVCLPVMHSQYEDRLQLLQVLEADRMLGAEKVILYVRSASPEVLVAIEHYVTSGVLEAIEWRVPFDNASLVHYFGQMIAVNDCLYNAMYSSRYVVFHDLDELMLPRSHDTWNLMMEQVLQEEVSWWGQIRHGDIQYGSYTFLHVVFPKNWTHPGIPGDIVIEGLNEQVPPNSVQPFVLGYKDGKRPSAMMEENPLADEVLELKTGEKRDIAEKREGRGEGERRDVYGIAGVQKRVGGVGQERQRDGSPHRSKRKVKKRAKRASEYQTIENLNQKDQGRYLTLETPERVRGLKEGDKPEAKSVKKLSNKASYGVPKEDLDLVNARESADIHGLQRQLSVNSQQTNISLKLAPKIYYKQQHLEEPSLSVSTNEDSKNLDPLRYTWRENYVWKSSWRCKMLVKPATIELMGIHNVHTHIQGYSTKDLPPEVGLTHHYRIWWVRNGTAMVHDTSARRLSSSLTANVEDVLKKIKRGSTVRP